MIDRPERILSFDGGGIRGIFSLQIAARIEQLFRDEYGCLRAIERLQTIGREYAAREVRREHFHSRVSSGQS